MKTYALDFETYYDKDCSIKKLGPRGYFSHPDFNAYMVSVVGDDGYSFVGDPRDFEWGILEGNIVLSHNASFDESLYLFGVANKWWDKVEPSVWYCTADMAAYCGMPRSLKGASDTAYGITVDKSTRDNMLGKRWEEMSESFKKEVLDYALEDSELCLKLFKDYEHKWPQIEKDISNLNRKIAQRGIPIDVPLMQKQLADIKTYLSEAERSIPWGDEKPLLSRVAFDDHCRSLGIEPPVSLAATDEDAQKWLKKYGPEYIWIEAVSNWRRINSIKKKIESFDLATMTDDRYYGGLMYFGAHTGRFSGSGGNLNLQNLPREEMFGCNLRHLISPKKNKRLIVVDLSQIEVRTLFWLAKDYSMLKEIANSADIYETFAIRFNMWTKDKGVLKKEDPKLRHKVKAMVLGCGYGAGAPRFASMYGMDIEEARAAVNTYRVSMGKIKWLWGKYKDDIEGSVAATGVNKRTGADNEPYTIDLPQRKLDYGVLKHNPVKGKPPEYVASLLKHSKKVPVRLWGGLCAENASQALARDVFSDMLIRLDKAGFYIIMHVHDEVVIEEDKGKAKESLAEVINIMSTPPEWIPDLPVAAEGSILTRYEK